MYLIGRTYVQFVNRQTLPMPRASKASCEILSNPNILTPKIIRKDAIVQAICRISYAIQSFQNNSQISHLVEQFYQNYPLACEIKISFFCMHTLLHTLASQNDLSQNGITISFKVLCRNQLKFPHTSNSSFFSTAMAHSLWGYGARATLLLYLCGVTPLVYQQSERANVKVKVQPILYRLFIISKVSM